MKEDPLETLKNFAKKVSKPKLQAQKNFGHGRDSDPRPFAWQTSSKILQKSEAEVTLVWQLVEASL